MFLLKLGGFKVQGTGQVADHRLQVTVKKTKNKCSQIKLYKKLKIKKKIKEKTK